MKNLPVYILLLIALIIPAVGFAADDGGTESVFNLGAGARAMGMGNGFTGLADDATAVYYNPAVMPYLSSQQISLLHTILFEGTIYDYVSYVYPGDKLGALGLAAMRIGTDDIGRRDDITDLGTFSASKVQFLMAYGKRFGRYASFGGTLKLVHQSIDDYSTYGYGIDLAGQLRLGQNIRAGFLLQDIIGPHLELDDDRERTPFNIRTGVAYLLKQERLPFAANFTFDLEKPEHRSAKIRTGLEVLHQSGIIVRSGYDRDNFTLGMGLQYNNLRFDYAYKFIDNLTDSHRFSLTLCFGATQEERAAREAAEIMSTGLKMMDDERRASLIAELEKANEFFAEGQLDSALAAYYRADAFAEDKAAIRSRIATVKRMMELKYGTSEIIFDTLSGAAGDFESQAHNLFERGALQAARDMAELAERYQGRRPRLDILKDAIAAAIAKEVSSSLVIADRAYGAGDYLTSYDAYNTVLLYEATNKSARNGSRNSEKQLNLAQHLNLALNYFNQGKYLSSQKEFSKVLELDPGNETAIEYSTRIGERIKKSSTLEELQKDEKIWQLYLNGLESFRQGEYEEAIEYWEQVLEVYPNNRNTIENIEQAKLRLDR